jgi:adenylate cyclase
VWRVVMDEPVVPTANEDVLRQVQHERLTNPVTLSQSTTLRTGLSKGDQKPGLGTAYLTRTVLMLAGLLIVGGIVAVLYPSFPSIRNPQSSIRNPAEPPPVLPFPDKPSIVVLPFVNLSGDSEQEYFSDGITEDLTTELAKLSGLFVIARNSAFVYKNKAVDVKEVSQGLGVRYVLEGSVRKAGDRVRITAQLLDAPSASHLWAESYDRELKDIFAMQDEVKQQVITALKVKLTEAEFARVRRIPTDNLTAYDYLWRGWEYFNRLTPEAHTQARQMFEKAIELDPRLAPGYVGLGWSYWLGWIWQWNPDPQTLERAFALTQKAIALDDSLANAHTLLGQVYLYKSRQYEQAIAAGERALALDPNCAGCYQGLGEILSFAGRPEEGIGMVEKAMRLDPYFADFNAITLGTAYALMEQYEKAIAPLKRVLSHYPDHLAAHLILAIAYSQLGREEEARAEAAEALRLNPHYSVEILRQMAPNKDRALMERHIEALRRAGLK